MQNGKSTITPNEINKFTYCPYQWYYERYYGRPLLRQLVKERSQAKSHAKTVPRAKTTYQNFAAGNRHHAEIHLRYKRNRILIRLLFVLFLAAFLLFFYQFKVSV